jgi:hypothetical protein
MGKSLLVRVAKPDLETYSRRALNVAWNQNHECSDCDYWHSGMDSHPTLCVVGHPTLCVVGDVSNQHPHRDAYHYYRRLIQYGEIVSNRTGSREE